jgi:radical SAM family RiPP maturation amino acid epimerase
MGVERKELSPFRYYEEMHTKRGPDQLRTISHIKRFMECLAGDPVFKDAARGKTKGLLQMTANRGIDLDPRELAPLFRKGFVIGSSTDELDNAPLAKLWNDWIVDKRRFVALSRRQGGGDDAESPYSKWRNRQIARCDSELGTANNSVIHSRMSLELSKGCSMCCWFCAFDAGKLEAVFPYTPENAKLWRGILKAALEMFGPAARSSACYHATEPTDNPDYLKFIRDYHDIMGIVPQTTTAAPLKDLGWTRELLRIHQGRPGVPSRFSILSLKGLREIHDTFSAEELLDVELILQFRAARTCKSRAGRVLGRKAPKSTSTAVPDVAQYGGTIACVTGFMVNMVDRSVRLITPCSASEQWPLGYKVLEEGSFESPQAFIDFTRQAMNTGVSSNLAGDDPVAFRPDLGYTRTDDGFKLSTRFNQRSLTGKPYLGLLGDLIQTANKTCTEIVSELAAGGADVFAVASTLQQLFDRGLLDEDLIRAS